MSVRSDGNWTILDGTEQITVVPMIALGRRLVTKITVRNKDTATRTFTLTRIDPNSVGSEYEEIDLFDTNVSLAAGESFVWREGCVLSPGVYLTLECGEAKTTNEPIVETVWLDET